MNFHKVAKLSQEFAALYPDVNEYGSLAEALQFHLAQQGAHLEVSEPDLPVIGTMHHKDRACQVLLGYEKRLFHVTYRGVGYSLSAESLTRFSKQHYLLRHG
jgi:hypothetical protein